MFQFVHVNSYSRTLSKKATHSKWSAKDVVAEATRDPSAIPHIDNPQAPIHVYGQPIEELLGTLDAWAAGTKDTLGRATRKDAVCLLAGVFSAQEGTPPDQWEQIKTDAIKWAQDKYGERLKTVLEHVDEGHPHCHFYVVPLPGESFDQVHEGRAAVKAFIAAGGEKTKSNAVYRDVMRGFQDEYYDAVGAPSGMTRIGPGKRRLTREAWKCEQQQAEAIAAQHARAQELEHAAEKTISAAMAKGSQIEQDGLQKYESLKQKARVLKDGAIAEATEIKNKAIEEADRIVKTAETTGFERGLTAFGALPWVQKASRFLSTVTKERDGLKVERDQLREQLQNEVKEHRGLKAKARKWLDGFNELTGLKPKFEKAQEDVEILKRQNKELDKIKVEKAEIASDLHSAKYRIGYLEERVKELDPPRPSEVATNEKAPRKGLDHDSITLG